MFQIICLCFGFTSLIFGDWALEESKVLDAASQNNLPILAVFLVKEGCCWSDKLQAEILENPEFMRKCSQEMILWKIVLTAKNAVSDKYQVKEYPLILLLDPKGVEFARISAIPFDYQSLKTLLRSLIEDFSLVCYLIDKDLSEEEYQDLYKKASRLSTPYFQRKIQEKGMKKEKGYFFHLEKYAQILQRNGLNNFYVVEYKKKLLKRDAKHLLEIRFNIASIEFAYLKYKNKPLEETIQPLVEYLQSSNQLEPQHLWQAELLIGQFLWEKRHLERAKKYLQLAYQHAPNSIKFHLLENDLYNLNYRY